MHHVRIGEEFPASIAITFPATSLTMRPETSILYAIESKHSF